MPPIPYSKRPPAPYKFTRVRSVGVTFRNQEKDAALSDVVKLLERSGVPITDIQGVQNKGKGRCDITFKSQAAFQKACPSLSSVQDVEIDTFGASITVMTALHIPIELDDNFVRHRLSEYGEVLDSKYVSYASQGFPEILTGTRQYRIRLKSHVPNTMRLGNETFSFRYAGQPRVCHRCGREGHLVVDCDEDKCSKCMGLGHLAQDCTSGIKCNVCGEVGHAGRSCQLNFPYRHALTSTWTPKTSKGAVPTAAQAGGSGAGTQAGGSGTVVKNSDAGSDVEESGDENSPQKGQNKSGDDNPPQKDHEELGEKSGDDSSPRNGQEESEDGQEESGDENVSQIGESSQEKRSEEEADVNGAAEPTAVPAVTPSMGSGNPLSSPPTGAAEPTAVPAVTPPMGSGNPPSSLAMEEDSSSIIVTHGKATPPFDSQNSSGLGDLPGDGDNKLRSQVLSPVVLSLRLNNSGEDISPDDLFIEEKFDTMGDPTVTTPENKKVRKTESAAEGFGSQIQEFPSQKSPSPNKDPPKPQRSRKVLVLAGDFNCVLDPGLDRRSESSFTPGTGTQDVVQLRSLCTDLDVVDAWRVEHPDQIDFTWRSKSNKTRSRLDRIYVPVGTTTVSEIKSCPFSDHDGALASIVLVPSVEQGRGLWKCNVKALEDRCLRENFLEQYAKWREGKGTERSLREWWDSTKGKIRDLLREHSKRKAKEASLIQQDLERQVDLIRSRLNVGDRSAPTLEKYNEAKEKLNKLIQDRLAGHRLRAKVKSFEEDEKPTRFFFASERQKGKKRIIHQVRNGKGDVVSTTPEILDTFQVFYKELYREGQIDLDEQEHFLSKLSVTLPDDFVESLDRCLSLSELQEAMKGMENGKSPGSDGLPKEFYFQFWDTIGQDFLEVLNEGLREGQLSATQREGVISLLEKKGDPLNPANKRPISLLNVDYKIMSKAMANRLKSVIASVVHADQSCGIPVKIEKVLFEFLWDGKTELVKRETLYLPKNEGGLGLVCVPLKANALLLKAVRKALTCPEAPSSRYVFYWMGLCLRRLDPESWDNNSPHSMERPPHYEAIIHLVRDIENMDAQIEWKVCTTKSIYNALLEAKNIVPRCVRVSPTVKWPEVWRAVHNPFVQKWDRMTAWHAAHDSLKTRQKLRSWRGYIDSDTCPRNGCNLVESVTHLFWECAVVAEVWEWVEGLVYRRIFPQFRLSGAFAVFGLVFQNMPTRTRLVLETLAAITRALLWKTRCQVIFEKMKFSGQELIARLQKSLRERLEFEYHRLGPDGFLTTWADGYSWADVDISHVSIKL
ncbi:ZCCHC3 [Branchiostoma lanceolatum]|uniref:ZCCHC3 protein n=1 Tax=Branchiostoma lanceolatum TaxID=7740 RepID=A0A8S4MM14_BRALA|nr:ZCCHC3 [Branchiostoma lanceolatum]